MLSIYEWLNNHHSHLGIQKVVVESVGHFWASDVLSKICGGAFNLKSNLESDNVLDRVDGKKCQNFEDLGKSEEVVKELWGRIHSWVAVHRCFADKPYSSFLKADLLFCNA
uniref:Uncharacterized protein n=1 Tax=Nelumbo nucifera TaxID=4432 RepID=A0A822Z9B4_NELNU|nr:TPA_asm: hypothetical protein HUJ06_014292 [Nelumbo nucifera]